MIVPSLNPDGRERAQEKECTSNIGQTNARGKDLDTDFTSKVHCLALKYFAVLEGRRLLCVHVFCLHSRVQIT